MTLLCVTANAAIDKRYDLPRVRVGAVQRIAQVHADAGGKGINAARAARLHGAAVVATGFCGGFAGQFIASRLRDLGVRDAFVPVAGESRTCLNIIDAAGASTELLEPGAPVDDADVDRLRSRFAELLGQVDAVTISGSTPAGCPDDLYADLVSSARSAGLPVVLDAGGAPFARALGARPSVVKPNRDELAAWRGRRLDSRDDVIAAARALRDAGPESVVVSLGSEGALAVTAGRTVLAHAPVVAVSNAVGCGDVLVGVLAAGLAEGLDVVAALRPAVAAAAAAAAHPRTGVFDPQLAASFEVPVTTVEES